MITTADSLEFLKERADYEFDINYSDPPYALGSEVIIRPDGKVDYKKANDFMNKWEMPTGEYWEQWFKEAYRTLKHGGYLIMFGMDRQLLLFKYYANLAGFEEQQSLYWYFISNFPKATDLSKMIDKNAGAEREVKNVKERKGNPINTNVLGNERPWMKEQIEKYGSLVDIETAPSTELAKKYEGYKYSISPLKQTNETIMVFRRPTKTGSVLHDTLAYENGDETITVSALNIDENRVETTENLNGGTYQNKEGKSKLAEFYDGGHKYIKDQFIQPYGRYPSQTFCDSNTAEVLAEPSKILHKCDFEKEDYDIYNYQPKVSKSERNAGCDGEPQQYSHDGRNKEIENPYQRNKSVAINNHPTLKPIKLNERILKLFKTPNDDKIVYPFAGSGSEIIGGIKAGFKNWVGCEINSDYVEIAKARIDYWTTQDNQLTIFDIERE